MSSQKLKACEAPERPENFEIALREQVRASKLDRNRKIAGCRLEELFQASSEIAGRKPQTRQWWEGEYQCRNVGAECAAEGCDDIGLEKLRREKSRIGVPAFGVDGRGDLPKHLEHTSKTVRKLACVVGQRGRIERPVIRAIDTDAAKQRIAGVFAETIVLQLALCRLSLVHDSSPARKRPGRGSEKRDRERGAESSASLAAPETAGADAENRPSWRATRLFVRETPARARA